MSNAMDTEMDAVRDGAGFRFQQPQLEDVRSAIFDLGRIAIRTQGVTAHDEASRGQDRCLAAIEAAVTAALAAAPAQTAAGLDLRVHQQVWAAARELDTTQKAQPDWLWHEGGKAVSCYGRWPKGAPGMAPYVRADIALGMLSAPSAAGGGETPGGESVLISRLEEQVGKALREKIGDAWAYGPEGTVRIVLGTEEARSILLAASPSQGSDTKEARGDLFIPGYLNDLCLAGKHPAQAARSPTDLSVSSIDRGDVSITRQGIDRSDQASPPTVERETWAAAWHRVVETTLILMDLSPALGGDEAASAIQAALAKLTAERDGLRAALEPFAAVCDAEHMRHVKDEQVLELSTRAEVPVSEGLRGRHFRAARAALRHQSEPRGTGRDR